MKGRLESLFASLYNLFLPSGFLRPLLNRFPFQEALCAALILFLILNLGFFSCIWGKTTLLESARDAPSILLQGASAGPPHVSRFLKVLDPGAAAWQTEPYLAFIRSEYRQQRLPLWDPYQGYGKPLAANMQSQPFYPLTLALLVRLTPRTYNWYILLRLFLAGLFGYLYFRLFVSFSAALGGGIATMLGGYYVLFITMPHLSVETLLPAAFYASERLLRQHTYGSVLFFASILLFVLLGGMPESALLLFVFLYCYLLLRVAFDPDLRQMWGLIFKKLLQGSFAALGLSAFLLLPFYEYLRSSWTSHTRGPLNGLVHDSLQSSIFTYLFPLLFGPPHSTALSDYGGLRNYFGVICFFLVIISVLAVSSRRKGHNRHLRFLTCFFFSFAIVLLLKRYGVPGVNNLGSLPLLRLIDIPKYEQPLLSFCIAALCAVGLDLLRTERSSTRSQISALSITFLTIPLALVISRGAIVQEMHIDRLHRAFPKLAIGLPLFLLTCVGMCIVFFRTRQQGKATTSLSVGYSRLSNCILILLAAEALLNFITPLYHLFNKLPLRADNPYLGAPYVDFLKSHCDGLSRIFGRDGVLVPNWASVFRLADIRDLDAMYYNKYFPFLDAFFPSRGTLAPDLESCFRGFGPYNFSEPLERRLLQLSSVKYILSIRPYTVPNPRIQDVLRQNKARLQGQQNLVGHRDLIIDGIPREALGEHPPYRRLPYKLRVGDKESNFHFSYALDPAVFDKAAGDGVGFTIEIMDPSGHVSQVFSDYIDPKHHIQQRRWMDGEIDLTRYRGQQIELLFSTDPGPLGNTSYDWAAWSNFHFDDESFREEQPFRRIYHNQASIYEYDNVLPRAAIYFHTDLESTETAVLQRLADPSLDIFKSVVLDASKLTAAQLNDAGEVNREAPLEVRPATITSYQPQAVVIEASLDRDGILVLNDSCYPGWIVSVDGQKSQWFAANYLFRGVFLKAGKHRVRFTYSPRSFYLGAAISLIVLASLLGIGLMKTQNGRKRNGASAPGPAS